MKYFNFLLCFTYKRLTPLILILIFNSLTLFLVFKAEEVSTNNLEEESVTNESEDLQDETSDKEDIETQTSIEVDRTEEGLEKQSAVTTDNTLLKGYVSKIPSRTKLSIIFETSIDEITSMIGDEITARIAKDIVIENDVVVPAGSTVIGKISEINYAKRFHRSGSVRVEFESLTIPDGRQIPIVASVLTRSGLIKGKLTKKAALVSGASIVGPAAAGFGAGLAAEGSPVGGLIGVAVGTLAGIALFSFQKGNMVDVKAGEEMNIELIEEAYIPSPKDLTNVELYKEDLEKMYEEGESKEGENVRKFDFTDSGLDDTLQQGDSNFENSHEKDNENVKDNVIEEQGQRQ